MFKVVKGYIVHAQTGCTCCSDENHARGPFRLREEAEKEITYCIDFKIIGSQFAPSGVYNIEEMDIEELPDGRLILEGRIVVPGYAKDTGEFVIHNY